MDRAGQRARKIAGIYALCGFLWIVLSDRLLAAIVRDSDLLTRFQTFKGWAFIGITALLVFLLSRRALREPERLAAEARAGEARFRALFENVNVVALVVDPSSGSIVDANEAAASFYGWPREQLRSMNITAINSLAHDEIRARMNEAESGKQGFFLFKHRRADGSERDVEVYTGPIPYQGRSALYSVIHDVTDRRRAEQHLRESEEMLRQSQRVAQIGHYTLDIPRGIWTSSAALDDIFGIGPAFTRTVDAWLQIVHPDERESMAAYFQNEVLAQRKPFDRDYRIIRQSDGAERWVHGMGALEAEAGGGIVRMFGTIQDITERKRTEKALRKSERMLQTIIDAEPECVKVLDENACLIMMNRAGLDMLQVDSLDQVKGQCVCPLVTSEYRPAFLDLTRRVFQGESGTLLFEMVGMKGRRLWLETHAVPLRNEKDEIVSVLGVTRDVTEWKRTEEALRQSEGRFRAIIEHATSGILVADIETGKFRYANPQICRMLGYDADELLALEVASIHPPAELPAAKRAFAAREEVQTLCLRKDGTVFPVEIRGVELEIDGRRCLAGFFTDITEKRLLEEERHKAQKLESIGTLAGGIAHDFNNLLQGVFGYISMAKLTVDQREKSLAMLVQAEKALHQSVNLTSQLLTFSKGGKPVRKATDLRPVIENAVMFALSGSRVSYDLSLDDDLRMVDADAGQIGQVVQNIVLNAEQSMPLGGRIEITARNVPASRAAGQSVSAPDGLVEIVVRDQGTGIPPGHLQRIFDPYFTTKEKGSGLGLATSYSIVRNHDGVIDVTSVLGKGSAFTVHLPATRAALEPVASSPSAERAAGKKGRVLVMDDEAMVRVVAAELLRELGQAAEFAEHGDEAIAKYQQAREEGRPFDVVILDLTIRGGKGGAETMRELLSIDPGVKAVVSSGYSDDEIVATYREHGFRSFLKKPYDMQGLARVLNEVMA